MKEPLTPEEFEAVPVRECYETFTDAQGVTHQQRRPVEFHLQRDDGVLFYSDADGAWTVYENNGALFRVRAFGC